MPVRPATACALLQSFGRLEFTLKRIPGFTRSARGVAAANWSAVEGAVDRLLPRDFLDRVSPSTKDKMLAGGRDRPMIEVADPVPGGHVARFEVRALPASDSRALVEAMRRVRNNLFHGGKEDQLAERYAGDDQQWAEAAEEVALLLLDLLDSGSLRP